jgi:hypothetical protein
VCCCEILLIGRRVRRVRRSRYERAGTIGFRCAQDLPVGAAVQDSSSGRSCGKALCGSFSPPSAFTDLSTGATEWAAWGAPGTGAGATRGSGESSGVISDISLSGGDTEKLKQCNVREQQVRKKRGLFPLISVSLNGKLYEFAKTGSGKRKETLKISGRFVLFRVVSSRLVSSRLVSHNRLPTPGRERT